MAQPLRSDDFTTPQNLQFTHFGILNAGSQSKSSLATAVTVNFIVAALLIAVGAETKKVVDERRRVALLVAPVTIKEPEPVPPPKVVLPKLPPPPVAKVELPKIQLPEVKLPDPPVVLVVHMNQPVPINTPAPPKLVKAPPAPVVVNLARAEAATVVNNNPHPAPVALGRADNPIAPSDRPATAAVNLGQRGATGMPSSNNGAGAHTVKPRLRVTFFAGDGRHRPPRRAGRRSSRTGGTGPMNSTGRNGVSAGQVNLGMIQQTAMPHPPTLAAVTTRSGPKVLYKPRPDYTPEARALHLEGTISVRLHVAASGAVTVIGVGNGLGHGLDESARRAVQSTRFQPAVDASGNPVEWDGVVNVVFQMAE